MQRRGCGRGLRAGLRRAQSLVWEISVRGWGGGFGGGGGGCWKRKGKALPMGGTRGKAAPSGDGEMLERAERYSDVEGRL